MGTLQQGVSVSFIIQENMYMYINPDPPPLYTYSKLITKPRNFNRGQVICNFKPNGRPGFVLFFHLGFLGVNDYSILFCFVFLPLEKTTQNKLVNLKIVKRCATGNGEWNRLLFK